MLEVKVTEEVFGICGADISLTGGVFFKVWIIPAASCQDFYTYVLLT